MRKAQIVALVTTAWQETITMLLNKANIPDLTFEFTVVSARARNINPLLAARTVRFEAWVNVEQVEKLVGVVSKAVPCRPGAEVIELYVTEVAKVYRINGT